MFTYLILHYKNADVTMNCIDSILSSDEGDSSIVVVDNASNNGSYEALVKHYEGKGSIHFLQNDSNLGYAKGNNVGFRFAKEVLKSKWICLANNDLVFSDLQWQTKISRFYEQHPFYVLGPDVVTPGGEHQNPFSDEVSNSGDISKKLMHDVIVWMLLKLRIQNLLKKLIRTKENRVMNDWEESIPDFKGVLHGSCLVFSPRYIDAFDGLYNGTYLYVEEEILCFILNRLGYMYSYCSDIHVEHRHATSLSRSITDERKRKMMIVRERIKSYRLFGKIARDKGDLHKYLVKEHINER